MFTARLEGPLNQLSLQFPSLISESEVERHLRDRLFYAMHKTLRDSARYLYNDVRISYTQLMLSAHKVETEASEGKGSIGNVKSKAASESNS